MAKKKNLLVASTKSDFVKLIKEQSDVSLTNEQAKKMYDVFTKIMKETIIGQEKLTMNGLGTFKVNKRKARMGKNPKTGETMKIKASKTVGFKPAPSFKQEL